MVFNLSTVSKLWNVAEVMLEFLPFFSISVEFQTVAQGFWCLWAKEFSAFQAFRKNQQILMWRTLRFLIYLYWRPPENLLGKGNCPPFRAPPLSSTLISKHNFLFRFDSIIIAPWLYSASVRIHTEKFHSISKIFHTYLLQE